MAKCIKCDKPTGDKFKNEPLCRIHKPLIKKYKEDIAEIISDKFFEKNKDLESTSTRRAVYEEALRTIGPKMVIEYIKERRSAKLEN